jgi:hypothetical protein
MLCGVQRTSEGPKEHRIKTERGPQVVSHGGSKITTKRASYKKSHLVKSARKERLPFLELVAPFWERESTHTGQIQVLYSYQVSTSARLLRTTRENPGSGSIGDARCRPLSAPVWWELIAVE